MLGTLVNAGCIVVGSLVGSLLESKLDDKFQNALYGALADRLKSAASRL